ncbi:MAG TPA: GNAT family N-acetyltransferase [Tepidisphaeraceae bacterium]|jgi:predicted acetyltransferase
MSLQLRWVGTDEIDRVAEARMLAYANARSERATYQQNIRQEVRSGPGDWLLAERNGEQVGTATNLNLTMWVGGAALSCQGVAYVGTSKTSRRSGGSAPGVGTAIMNETLRSARERGHILSALMPFRGSYYEHFGYGFVERRAEWKIPLELIPRGDFSTIRMYRDSDFDELVACRNRIAKAGQCDIERSPEMWRFYLKQEHGFLVVDRDGDGPVRGWMNFDNQHADGLDTVRAYFDTGYEDPDGLKRLLHFLGSLKDQYRFASIQLPAGERVNLLLNEKQMTHRASKNHPNAEVRNYNRMQVRILDHKKFLESLEWPFFEPRKNVVAVHEPEGTVSKFQVEVVERKCSVTPTHADADLECDASTWAMIACGDLSHSEAADMGLAKLKPDSRTFALLTWLGVGTPYCREYF